MTKTITATSMSADAIKGFEKHDDGRACYVQPSPRSVVTLHPTTDQMEAIHLPQGKEENVVHSPPHDENDDASSTSGSNISIVNTGNHAVWSTCPASIKSARTINPIRAIVDPIFKNIQSGEERGDGKDPISLALGDPTVGGNLPPCIVALDAIVDTIRSTPNHAAGYVNACGTTQARNAIAHYHSYPEHTITADNVIVASGCSGSLEIVLSALLDPGTSILVPQPGFPLYQVIAESHGASVLHYRLDPNNNWECDFDHLEELMATMMTSNTASDAYNNNSNNKNNGSSSKKPRALLLNNPSNPTGAVFSHFHLQSVVAFCDKHNLVLVADEVYGELTFGRYDDDNCDDNDDNKDDNHNIDEGQDKEQSEVQRKQQRRPQQNHRHVFYPMAQVVAQCGRRVPVISTSGLAKQYLLPGWRVGWITFHDNIFGSLNDVEAGAKRLAQVVLGTSHLVQTVIPKVLDPDDPVKMDEWRESLRRTLQEQAVVLCNNLSSCHGLRVIKPQGAMYSMIMLDLTELDVQDDIDFTSRLLQEENVIVLPGTAFGCPNSFRVVFCSEEKVLENAAGRIRNFCLRHAR